MYIHQRHSVGLNVVLRVTQYGYLEVVLYDPTATHATSQEKSPMAVEYDKEIQTHISYKPLIAQSCSISIEFLY